MTSKAIDRLIVECGKYKGKVAGETLQRKEVTAQAVANGYDRGFCEELPQTVEIPPQGDLLGDLWPGNKSTGLEYPNVTDHQLEQHAEWLNDKRNDAYPYAPKHAWSNRWARKKFGQLSDCERYFWTVHGEFTTVMLTRCADGLKTDIEEHAKAMNPPAYSMARNRLLKDVSEEYAGVAIRAPKYDLPYPNVTALTHYHEIIYVPGHHPREAFLPWLEAHLRTVDGASRENHPPDRALTVWHHETARTPSGEERRLSREAGTTIYRMQTSHSMTEALRGETCGLNNEIASNLPMMQVPTDALDLHDSRAFEWCAAIWRGREQRGLNKWQGFGQWSDTQAKGRALADLREARVSAKAIRDSLDKRSQTSHEQAHAFEETARALNKAIATAATSL